MQPTVCSWPKTSASRSSLMTPFCTDIAMPALRFRTDSSAACVSYVFAVNTKTSHSPRSAGRSIIGTMAVKSARPETVTPCSVSSRARGPRAIRATSCPARARLAARIEPSAPAPSTTVLTSPLGSRPPAHQAQRHSNLECSGGLYLELATSHSHGWFSPEKKVQANSPKVGNQDSSIRFL